LGGAGGGKEGVGGVVILGKQRKCWQLKYFKISLFEKKIIFLFFKIVNICI
jgi:hypothetical protein